MHSQDEVELIYQTYSKDVYQYLLYLCGNPDVAEDLTQETFLHVMKGIMGFRGESSLKTWIFTIARHAYYHWRHRNPNILSLDESFYDTSDTANMMEHAENKDMVQTIMRYIHQLEEPCQTLMILRLTGDMPFKDIAAILGKTETWARVTFMRTKCKLIETWKEEYP